MLRLVKVTFRDDLRRFCHFEPDVDGACEAWCRAAEVGLLSAYKAACCPCPQGDQPFLGRGGAVSRTSLVGGELLVGFTGRQGVTRLVLLFAMSVSIPPLLLSSCFTGGSARLCPEWYLE